MKHQEEVMSLKRQRAEKKKKRQTKIMTALGIAMAVLVAAIAVAWLIFNINAAQTRNLSEAEMRQLFEDDNALPKKDSKLIGTWYYYVNNDVVSKYVLDDKGMMNVYERRGDDFVLIQTAPYRVREKANMLYVLPDMAKTVVSYEYEITKDQSDSSTYYQMHWIYKDKEWYMIKVAE